MRVRPGWTVVVVGLVACGGGDGDPPPDATDGPSRVTLRATGAEYVRYKDGDGPWREPERVVADDWALEVVDDYVYVIGCEDGPFDVHARGVTVADGDVVIAECGFDAEPPPPPDTVAVTGEMVQPGSILLGAWASSNTGPWQFSLDVPPGTYDLVALTSDRVLIDRGVSITGATTVPTIDVDQDGAAVEEVSLTITGLDDVTGARVSYTLFTAGGAYANLDGSTATMRRVPAPLVQPYDAEVLSVSVFLPATYRSARTEIVDPPPTIALMPELTGVAFTVRDGVVAATWQELPPHTELALRLASADGDQSMSASRAWLDATGATSLAFPADLPDFPGAWNVDLSRPYTRAFWAYDRSGDVSYTSSVAESVNMPAAAAAPLRDPDVRAHRHRRGR